MGTANTTMGIPIIDISSLHALSASTAKSQSSAAQETVAHISSACQSHGFFAITNHGVPSSLISAVCASSAAFFDCDTSIKTQVCMSDDYPYGYENCESLGTELRRSSSSVGAIDSKETFSIGPSNEDSGMPCRRFPSDPASFQETLTSYYTAMETLSRTLFRGFALALGMDDPDWFLRDGVFDSAHQCALRILNYPSLELNTTTSSSSTVIRAGAHTDYGAMTILLPGGPGLQLCLSSDSQAEGVWIDVPHLDGSFIINLGDLMQRWTNDRWRSTLHRVVAVPDESNDGEEEKRSALRSISRRQSIAFFVNMNGETNIVPFESCVDDDNPVRYGAIKASDHLMQRHLRSMGKKK